MAVVTGGANGIGRVLSATLAREGARVIALDVDVAALSDMEEGQRKLGRPIVCLVCDLTSDDATEQVGARIAADFGTPDIVFNNASLPMLGSPEAVVIDDWRRALDVNVLGYVRMMRAFAPGMIARGSGYFVNVSSSMGIAPDPGGAAFMMPYVTTKAAGIGLSQAMAAALRPHGIGVSLFLPAITDTWSGRPPGDAPAVFVEQLKAVTLDGVTAQATVNALIAGVRQERFLITNEDGFEERLARLVANGLDSRLS